MIPQEKAKWIVEKMMSKDAFSQWLGVRILEVGVGYSTISAEIRPDMVNGFGICHGGISFSLADSAFAFASNSHGVHAVSIETSISHIKAVKVGDILTMTAVEKHLGKSTAIYHVEVINQNQDTVALFKGTVFRTGKVWE
jgi:acyl-CoA thioesterase